MRKYLVVSVLIILFLLAFNSKDIYRFVKYNLVVDNGSQWLTSPPSTQFDYDANFVKSDMIQVFNYTLWHYEKGSQFDTPFWKNAMKIVERGMNDICLFRNIEASKLHSYNTFSNWDPQYYMQWSQLDFKKWSELN